MTPTAPTPDTRHPTPAATGGDYRVELEAYSGPLDLLLYLVRRHEIDLHDIPIAQLTEQYLEHLKVIQDIDVNLAGEFLVMAATLLEIKSQMIIPAAEAQPGAAEGEGAADESGLNALDPRFELVQQLLAYKRFKDAAGELDERWDNWHARFASRPKKAAADETVAEEVEIDLEDASVLDLCDAFARMLDSIGQKREHEVTYDDTPIELHAADIVDRLQREGDGRALTLQELFIGRESRSELIGLFLATLELVKQRRIRVVQDRVVGEIRLSLVSADEQQAIVDREDHATDWRDPQTGEMQYDWPDPEAKTRAEARARRRGERLAKIRRGETVEPDEDDEAIEIDAVDDIDRKLREISEDGKPAT
jgi:segregation and condensation protein A